MDAQAQTAGAGSPSSYRTDLPDHIAIALCYLPFAGFLVGIALLLIEPYNTNRGIRFHAVQSILLFAAYMVVQLVLTSIGILPLVGVPFAALAGVLPFVMLLVWVLLMYKTYSRESVNIPVLGSIAEKQV